MKNAMKTKINVQDIERTIDFENVNQKLLTLMESGGFKRRKTVTDLLDKVQGALIKARKSGVSFSALTTFLQESGIPASQATLRKYLHAHIGSKKSRKKSATGSKATRIIKAQPERKSELQSVQSRIDKNRAAFASYDDDHSDQGPRIADPKNV